MSNKSKIHLQQQRGLEQLHRKPCFIPGLTRPAGSATHLEKIAACLGCGHACLTLIILFVWLSGSTSILSA